MNEATTYYYKAYVLEFNESTGEYEYRYGEVKSFTTLAKDFKVGKWLELPAFSTAAMKKTTTSSLTDLYEVTHHVTNNGEERNYSILYDPEMFASYWVAYPLAKGHMGTISRDDKWSYDDAVPRSKQTNLVSGSYGVSISTPNYDSNLYSRGHQIASSDRKGNADMMDQTFFMTNLTPQIQNGFNGGIWGNLESGIQSVASSYSDTVYVVTGAAFRKATDGTESITTIVNKNDGKTIPVPNYYWKALLKVRRSGSTITAAKAIGFWLPHKDLQGENYTSYVVSVDDIESWTGFDLFANLDESLQASAEQLSSYSTDSQKTTRWNEFRNY